MKFQKNFMKVMNFIIAKGIKNNNVYAVESNGYHFQLSERGFTALKFMSLPGEIGFCITVEENPTMSHGLSMSTMWVFDSCCVSEKLDEFCKVINDKKSIRVIKK